MKPTSPGGPRDQHRGEDKAQDDFVAVAADGQEILLQEHDTDADQGPSRTRLPTTMIAVSMITRK